NSGKRVGVVSRGYKSRFKQPRRVDLSVMDCVNQFGDEPCMLAQRNPGAFVYVGVNRSEVVKKLLDEQQVDVILADDAFQHRKLYRNLDIVIIDLLEEISNYALL